MLICLMRCVIIAWIGIEVLNVDIVYVVCVHARVVRVRVRACLRACARLYLCMACLFVCICVCACVYVRVCVCV